MRKLLRTLMLMLPFMFLTAGILFAQTTEKVVNWEYTVEKISDKEYNLLFTARIQDGWHLYSQFIGEGGPVPTQFRFKEASGVVYDGPVKELSTAEKVHDIGFDMDLVYFSHEARFIQRVKLSKPVNKINGSLEFMVCDDSKCLPPDVQEFSFNLKNAKSTN